MKPSTLKVLRELERNDSVTTSDFLNSGCGVRYGARLHELRKAGYIIEEQRLPNRSGSRYRLVAVPPSRTVSVPPRDLGEQGQLFAGSTSHYLEAA